MIEQNRYTITDAKTNITEYLSLNSTKNFIYGKIFRDIDDIIKQIDDGGIYLIENYKIEIDLTDYFKIENDYKDNMVKKMSGLL